MKPLINARANNLKQVEFSHYVEEKLSFFSGLGEVSQSVMQSIQTIIECFTVGGKLLICGNGGSASDSNHIATEFVNGLGRDTKFPLPAISMSADNSVITSCGNDFSFSEIFAAQIHALAKDGDCVFALTTSGNSKNILLALEVAKEKHLTSVVLTGAKPNSRIFELSENVISLPSQDTQSIQEGTMLIYHYICRHVIQHFRNESIDA